MSELQWINVASKSFAYCAHVLQQIIKLQETLAKIEKEAARLKTLVEKQEKLIQDLTGKDGSYDTVH